MIRREHDEAEGMERLSAEYLTLATDGPSRTLGHLARALGAHRADLDAVRSSEAHGPLLRGIP